MSQAIMPPNCSSGAVPEAPPSLDMPSPVPLRPPAVQESPPAPPGKAPVDIMETTTSAPPLTIRAPEEVKSSTSTHGPPAAAAATPDTADSSSGSSSSSSSGSDDDAREYANIERTRKNDVLCGRGVTTNRHPGNEKFRALVHANKELYVSSNKRDKMAISRSIVEAVRARRPPGRFLEKDVDTGLWFDIGDKKAIEKTSQALRDGAAAYRRQLSDDMSDPNFLEAVFDGEAEGDHSKRDSEHRRTNSDPGHHRTSSGSTKRKSPSGEAMKSLRLVPSDEKEQKEALERMSKAPAGAASVPFRPDRRPVRREHKRAMSFGRMYSRDTPPGMPYPRQTPPASPRDDPYHHRWSESPYGYEYGGPPGHSPYPYHCPPTPTSPGMMRYSRAYNSGGEHHQPPPSPHHHHHHYHPHARPSPSQRSNSDPGSPGGHYPPSYGPPSPVSYGRKGAPPPPPSPGSPRKGGYQHSPHEGWGSPRPYGAAHGHGPGRGPPVSPRPGHRYPHSPYQHPSPHHQRYYSEQYHNHSQHHPYRNQSHHSPSRHSGQPPLSPRSSGAGYVNEPQDMVVEDRMEPEPPTLSIPTLCLDSSQDQADAVGGDSKTPEGKTKNESERPPPPKWYPTPQRAPRSPVRSGKGSDDDVHLDDNPFAPPPSRLLRHERSNKEELSSSRQLQEEKKPSARSMLLPERMRIGTLPPRETKAELGQKEYGYRHAQPREASSTQHSRKTAMSSLDVSPEASFDYGEQEPPPEQICKSFTFINGQLLENDAPVNVTSSTDASTAAVDMALHPYLHRSSPPTSNSPDTPNAVNAVEKFPLELAGEPSLGKGPRSEANIAFDSTDAHANASAPEGGVSDDPAASPLPEFFPAKDDDSMLVMDDVRGLSPLPFDGSGEMNDEPFIDLSALLLP